MEINENEVVNILLNVSEHFQLLHHSFVYNLNKSVLIVGDKSGKVIHSTKINYTVSLKEAYAKVLNDLKNFTLSWIYGNSEDLPASQDVQPPQSPTLQ
jgi:hypothetical protein